MTADEIPCPLLSSQRALFDIPEDLHYLNCAYISPLLKASRAAGEKGLAQESHPWEITAPDFFAPVEEIRGLFARLIGATAEDIALVPATSYGIATAARNLALPAGKRVLTLADQYPSNVYSWRDLAARNGAEWATVPRPADGDWTAAVLAMIDERVAIAALPHNHWMDGGLLDLARIGAALRAAGAALVIDASQSLGANPLDLAAVQPDFLVTSGYKWMMGPYGFSYLYVAPRHQDGQSLEESPHNWLDGEDFPRMAELKADHAPGARRFDVGERAHFTLLPAAREALVQLNAWTPVAVAATLGAMTAKIAAAGAEMGLTSLPAGLRAPHFIGLRFPRDRYPDGPPQGLPEALAEAKVHVSLRGTSLRVTPHLYNDETDIDALFTVLARVLG